MPTISPISTLVSLELILGESSSKLKELKLIKKNLNVYWNDDDCSFTESWFSTFIDDNEGKLIVIQNFIRQALSTSKKLMLELWELNNEEALCAIVSIPKLHSKVSNLLEEFFKLSAGFGSSVTEFYRQEKINLQEVQEMNKSTLN